MDIFKFNNNPATPTKMEHGEIINGIQKKMWIERHQREGEFSLIGYAKDGLREKLPLGSYISHVDSYEVMVVEDHEINSARNKEAEIKISGRSLFSFLEQRVPGANRSYPVSDGLPDVLLPADYPHWQIVQFIRNRLTPGSLTYAEDAFLYLTIRTFMPNLATNEARYIKVGSDGLTETVSLLKAKNLGVRGIRPGKWHSRIDATTPDDDMVWLVHAGTDLSATVIFSYDLGEIDSADYLWSTRDRKTLAVVTGKWVGVRAGTGETYDQRRMVHVDVQNVDNLYNVAPTSTALTNIQNALTRRGLDVVNAKKDINIVNVNISKEGTHLKYRKDFFVGDVITVNGEYNAAGKFRISEYVEIEDENGSSGYPTLILP